MFGIAEVFGNLKECIIMLSKCNHHRENNIPNQDFMLKNINVQ